MPESLLDHAWIGGQDPIGGASQVDIDQVIPVGGLAIMGQSADANPRIVEQEIEAIVLREDHVYHFLKSIEVSDIQLNGDGQPASLSDAFGHLLSKFHLSIGHDDEHVLGGQFLGQRLSNA
jgi:hypothetical protein